MKTAAVRQIKTLHIDQRTNGAIVGHVFLRPRLIAPGAEQSFRIIQRKASFRKTIQRIFQQQLLCTGSRSGTHCSESFRSGTAAATGSGAAAGTGSADHDKQCSEKGHPDPGFLKKPQISKE